MLSLRFVDEPLGVQAADGVHDVEPDEYSPSDRREGGQVSYLQLRELARTRKSSSEPSIAVDYRGKQQQSSPVEGLRKSHSPNNFDRSTRMYFSRKTSNADPCVGRSGRR